MSSTDRKSLWKDIKSVLRVTSVKKLKARGRERVRVIGMDQIMQLIDRAVERTIEQRMLSIEQQERDRIVQDAREEFKRLSSEMTQLSANRDDVMDQVSQAEAEVDRLRLEIQESRRNLETVHADAVTERFVERGLSDRHHLLKEVGEIIDETMSEGGDDGFTKDRLVSRLTEVLASAPATTLDVNETEYKEQISVLERRMAKLKKRLSQAEDILASAQGGPIESGIASIYKNVQGLALNEGNREKKKGLMSVIYQANVKLQKGD